MLGHQHIGFWGNRLARDFHFQITSEFTIDALFNVTGFTLAEGLGNFQPRPGFIPAAPVAPNTSVVTINTLRFISGAVLSNIILDEPNLPNSDRVWRQLVIPQLNRVILRADADTYNPDSSGRTLWSFDETTIFTPTQTGLYDGYFTL